MVKWIVAFFGMSGSVNTQQNTEQLTAENTVVFELKTEGRPVVDKRRGLTYNKRKYTRNDRVKASLAL